MFARPAVTLALLLLTRAQPLFAQAAPTPPPLTAKISETLLGPVSQRVYLSGDGDHLALVVPKGSRQVVMIDGVEGPAFDDIPNQMIGANNLPVQFSSTGGRSGYIGLRAGSYVAMIDGKEVGTIISPATQGNTGDVSGWNFFFNADGSHLVYGMMPGPSAWVMVTDGVKGAAYRAIDFKQIAVIGRRVIYVAQTTDAKWHLVVDGKVGPGYDAIRSLLVTPDAMHYAFIGTKGPMMTAVSDGVEGTPGFQTVSDLIQAPDGRIAYMGLLPPKPGPGEWAPHLIIGGLDVPHVVGFRKPGQPAFGGPLAYASFSPDGKRFAYIQQNTPNPGVSVLVNGKAMGPTYNSAGDLTWSPDGSRLAFAGTSPAGTFVVIDGQESEGYNSVTEFQFSPDGKRSAFRGYRAAANGGFFIVLDGKEQPKARNYSPGIFSPDSKHFVYASTSSINLQPLVDGIARPGNLANWAVHNPRAVPPLVFPQFNYSPDGNRLAYVSNKADGTSRAVVYVDGASFEGTTPSYSYPSWTPDSKRFAVMNFLGTGWTLMVDGKASKAYDAIVENNTAGVRFLDNQTFRFYGVKGGQVYRVIVDLSLPS